MKDIELNKIDDNIILDIFISKKYNIVKSSKTSNKFLNEHPNIKQYLLNRYNEKFDEIGEILYRIKNNINIRPVCIECGNHVAFISFSKGYRKFCCNKCINKNKETKNKIFQTKIKKYGNGYYHNIEKMKQTCIKKYGTYAIASKEIKDKIKNTCIKKYGVDNILKSSIIRKRIQETCLQKYGAIAPNLYGSNEYNENIFKKYGVKYISQLESVQEKIKETCLQKYGVLNALQTEKAKINSKSKNALYKKYITMKRNHTFNSSKVEKQFKEYLKQNFPNDFEYQYKSELYPFNCDFYIKSLDLYIEIQGSWTHGGHPFDKNNKEDIKRLNDMKSKNSGYYQNAINTWTIRDVNKRNMAKQNNLNYLEIFSKNINIVIKQFNEYIKH